MINIPITKILFLDIETVGSCKDYQTCIKSNPRVAEQFDKYFDWFLKRFPEDKEWAEDRSTEEHMDMVFRSRAALVPEFAKIVSEVRDLLNRCHKLDFYLCGHNLKNFDIPMLAKRMIINGIMPSKILPSYDTKPWEVKAIDTKEIWQYGAYTAIGSLDLMCACLDIPTPKDGEVNGGMVHSAYWEQSRLKEISEYCERDVEVLIDAIMKLKSLK
jgi:hypothetical protein